MNIHGGPGAGSTESTTQLFDPKFYRIILFDQRGAGQSLPHAEMRDNNTQSLISDIEKLREHLKIDKWVVSGGSWGSALSLLYAQTHPDKVQGLILRGIFKATEKEYNHLFWGMGKTYPEAWYDFAQFLPANERSELKQSYYKRLMDPNPSVHMPAARAFTDYDTKCAMLYHRDDFFEALMSDDKFVLSISRGFFHYAFNSFFLKENQIINNMQRIKHIPTLIVHGRFDTICPAENAFELVQSFPKAALTFIRDAGHSASEPGISLALVAASEEFKNLL